MARLGSQERLSARAPAGGPGTKPNGLANGFRLPGRGDAGLGAGDDTEDDVGASPTLFDATNVVGAAFFATAA